jgi:Ca2+-binding RTX toxin-like protein
MTVGQNVLSIIDGPTLHLSQLTTEHVSTLRELWEADDRGAFYLYYYKLTGSVQSLIQAHIGTYSGLYGGAALIGNAIAKHSNPELYSISLDEFSSRIVQGLLVGIEESFQNGAGTGVLSNDAIQQRDQGVWTSLGMGDYFPGNFQLYDDGISNLLSAGTLSSGLAAIQLTYARVGFDANDFQGERYQTVNTADVSFIIDSATGKVVYVEAASQPFVDTAIPVSIGFLGFLFRGIHPTLQGTVDPLILKVYDDNPVSEGDPTSSALQAFVLLAWNAAFGETDIDVSLRTKFTKYLGAAGQDIDHDLSLPTKLTWNSLPIVLKNNGTYVDDEFGHIVVGYDQAVLLGKGGGDILIGFGSTDASGGEGRDLLFGKGSAVLHGDGENDWLAGSENVQLFGDAGDDTLLAAGTAVADGGAGADWIAAFEQATAHGGDDEDILLGKGAVTLAGGNGDDLILFWNAETSSPEEKTQVDGGAGNDTVAGFGTAIVNLGAGDDLFLHAGRGSIVHGGAGADTFWLTRDVLIADADHDDTIALFGVPLTGGLRFAGSELPWAVGPNLIRYGMNAAGELIIRDWFGSDTYVAGFDRDLDPSTPRRRTRCAGLSPLRASRQPECLQRSFDRHLHDSHGADGRVPDRRSARSRP